eukprot:13379322-Alexandrium_andersonii.AAC.1
MSFGSKYWSAIGGRAPLGLAPRRSNSCVGARRSRPGAPAARVSAVSIGPQLGAARLWALRLDA